jgi:two-component system, OmpR family, response regulator TctD
MDSLAVICLSKMPRESASLQTMKILLIEDDEAMRTTLARALVRRGFAVEICADGGLALNVWHSVLPDVVLLDLTLPGRDGLQVLSDARAQSLTTPVLILTARGTVGDRVLGLNSGADDYLPKPFDLDELEARVRALVRAAARKPDVPANADTHVAPERRHMGALGYDKSQGVFYLHDVPMELSARETALLLALFERTGQAVSKEKLFERVFPGAQDVQYEAIEVVAYRLRKKLQTTGVKLVTLRGLGYLLKLEV